MDEREIQQRIVKVICQVLNLPPEKVTRRSNFIFDLGVESTESIALMTGFEREFGIEMEHEDALQVQTVSEAVDFIRKYLQRQVS
jgi:acyl carrier protein